MRRITLCILGVIWLGAPAKAETERIFERVSPSVVIVEVSDAAGKPVSEGSGVVIGPGTVITNCHVAEDGARLAVTHLGKTFAATLQYADTDRDLCQLSVPKLSAPAVALGDAQSLKAGHRHRLFMSATEGHANRINALTMPRTWRFGTPLATKGMPSSARMPTSVI